MHRTAITFFRRGVAALALVSALAIPSLAQDYVVKSGDTLSAIAARFNTTVDTIRQLNGLSGSLIHVGQVLHLPGSAPAPAATVEHVVVGGDTLSAIAARYGTTVAAIRQANNLLTNTIVVGQRLTIPTGSSAPSSPASSFSHGSSTSTAPTAPSTSPGATVTPSSNPADRIMPAISANSTELEVLARIVKGECPEPVPFVGKVAVAAVVLNRVRSSRFPDSITSVAHQPLQFSCYNANVRKRLYWGQVPSWAYDAARAALAGQDPTGGSTHYFNPYIVMPSWRKQMVFVRRIENTGSNGLKRLTAHVFYRPKGALVGGPGISGLLGSTHN
ncbi:MAG: LysM peptidoglycan-binding domain-containing protein [Planctomycetota bacterium]